MINLECQSGKFILFLMLKGYQNDKRIGNVPQNTMSSIEPTPLIFLNKLKIRQQGQIFVCLFITLVQIIGIVAPKGLGSLRGGQKWEKKLSSLFIFIFFSNVRGGGRYFSALRPLKEKELKNLTTFINYFIIPILFQIQIQKSLFVLKYIYKTVKIWKR